MSVICILFIFSACCICCYPVAAFTPRIRHGERLEVCRLLAGAAKASPSIMSAI